MPRKKAAPPQLVFAQDDSGLPPEFEAAVDRAIADSMSEQPGELPAYMRTTTARQAFQAAFETVGGMPRLAIWANKNYGRFVQLYSRMLPLTLSGDDEKPIHVVADWLTNTRFSGNVVHIQQQPQPQLDKPGDEDDPQP